LLGDQAAQYADRPGSKYDHMTVGLDVGSAARVNGDTQWFNHCSLLIVDCGRKPSCNRNRKSTLSYAVVYLLNMFSHALLTEKRKKVLVQAVVE